MICTPCMMAGDMNQMMNKIDDEKIKQSYKNQSQVRHDMCYKKDCMCQHRVGVYVEKK